MHFQHKTAEVDERASIGKDTYIWNEAQIREGAKIGDKCIIGKGVYIDKEVRIGSGCKLQNYASIYNGVSIEDNVFIGPGVAFTNDKCPRAFNRDWKIVETVVREGASIGANSTIVCGIEIGRYALVGAGSVVTKDVEEYSVVVGNPAIKVGSVDRNGKRK